MSPDTWYGIGSAVIFNFFFQGWSQITGYASPSSSFQYYYYYYK